MTHKLLSVILVLFSLNVIAQNKSVEFGSGAAQVVNGTILVQSYSSPNVLTVRTLDYNLNEIARFDLESETPIASLRPSTTPSKSGFTIVTQEKDGVHYLDLDENLKEIGEHVVTKADKKALRKGARSGEYSPLDNYVLGFSGGVLQAPPLLLDNNRMIKLLSHSSSDKVIIVGFRQKSHLSGNYDIYSADWTIELDEPAKQLGNSVIRTFGGDEAYAYYAIKSAKESGKKILPVDEYMVCFNLNTGALKWKVKIELPGDLRQATVSNFIKTDDGNLVVAGNYLTTESAQTDGKSMTHSQSRMDGYYFMNIQDGQVKNTTKMPFSTDVPAQIKPKMLKRKAMRFQEMELGADGNIKLLGQLYAIDSYTSTGENSGGQVTTHNIYAYRIESFEINSELEIVKTSKFETKNDINLGTAPSLVTQLYGQNLYTLVLVESTAIGFSPMSHFNEGDNYEDGAFLYYSDVDHGALHVDNELNIDFIEFEGRKATGSDAYMYPLGSKAYLRISGTETTMLLERIEVQ